MPEVRQKEEERMRTKLLMIVAGCLLAMVPLTEAALIADNFGGGGESYLINYLLDGQSGTLSPMTYAVDGSPTWRTGVTDYGSDGNEEIRIYPTSGTVPTFGFSSNLEYETMSISADLAGGDATLTRMVIGGNAAAAGVTAGSFNVSVEADGDVVVLTDAWGGNTLTFTDAGKAGYNYTNIRIDLTNTAYDGTGTATIDLWVDDVQMDLNGAGAGNTLTRTGFTDNYISFMTAGSSGSGLIDNISIIPEPATLGLVGISALGLLAGRRVLMQ
jgi:hypothetical protein